MNRHRFLAPCLLLLALLSCTSNAPSPDATLALEKAPERVIAFAPSIVEYLYAMDLQDRIVGASAYATFPAEAASLPVMGHVNEPDFEQMLKVRPQLILGLGEAVKVRDVAERLEVPIETLRLESLSDIIAAPKTLGDLLGAPEAGNRLSQTLQDRLDALPSRSSDDAPSVLIVIGRAEREVFTTGPGSFVTEMITRAGGRSVTADAEKRWFNLDWERVLKTQPDVILIFHSYDDATPEDLDALVRAWDRYDSLPAVRNVRVHVIAGSHVLKSGPRIFDALDDVAAVLQASP